MRTLVKLLTAATLIASSFTAAAHSKSHKGECSFESDYALDFSTEKLSFSRDDGTPKLIEISGGNLWVDGKVHSISSADSTRLREYEKQIRHLIPIVKDIAYDAIEIAMTALEHVVASFASIDEKMVEKTHQRIAQIRDRLQDTIKSTQRIDEEELEQTIKDAVAEFLPMMIGNIVSLSVTAALSGDEAMVSKIEEKARDLEATIEREVEARAKKLEARANALCPLIEKIDQIERDLELRLVDNAPLDLVQLDR